LGNATNVCFSILKYVKFKWNLPLWTNYNILLQPLKFGTDRLFWVWLIDVSSAYHCNIMFELVPSVELFRHGKNFSTCWLACSYLFIYVIKEQKRMLMLYNYFGVLGSHIFYLGNGKVKSHNQLVIYHDDVLGTPTHGTTQVAEPKCCTKWSSTWQGGNKNKKIPVKE
jgi:hypothetical protein